MLPPLTAQLEVTLRGEAVLRQSVIKTGRRLRLAAQRRDQPFNSTSNTVKPDGVPTACASRCAAYSRPATIGAEPTRPDHRHQPHSSNLCLLWYQTSVKFWLGGRRSRLGGRSSRSRPTVAQPVPVQRGQQLVQLLAHRLALPDDPRHRPN